jgi:hypothetical protein
VLDEYPGNPEELGTKASPTEETRIPAVEIE